MNFFINELGAPRITVSDRRSAFMGNEFNRFCKKYGIEHKFIAAQFLQAKGMAESTMQSIVSCIVFSINFDDENGIEV